MQRRRIGQSASLFVISVLLACSAGTANAESALWNTTLKVLLSDRSYGSSPWSVISKWEYSAFHNPNITVSYYTRVRNADTGAVVACGSTVPVGTRLTLEFLPHEYTHISWSGTGGSFDTPYGAWVSAAGKPASNMCSHRPERDYFKTYSTKERGLNNVTGKIYVTLSANPPAKTLNVSNTTGALSCGGSASSASRTCTASSPGKVNANFQFAATQAKFYARTLITQGGLVIQTNSCHTSNRAMQWRSTTADSSGNYSFGNTDYVVNIPARTISCPITIAETPSENTPPAAPTVAAAAGACVIGAPHVITMSATDPDGDTLRYLIDWDADGSVDQLVPGSGFVSSGTAQAASRTYAVAGAKNVQIRAEDSNGLLSPWQTLSFTCSGDAIAALDEDGTGGTAGEGAAGLPLTSTDLSLRIIPSLVRSGNTTQVNWSATGVTSCTVTAPNGDAWEGALSPPGGETSSPITGKTVYALACVDSFGLTVIKTATVNIVPSWQER